MNGLPTIAGAIVRRVARNVKHSTSCASKTSLTRRMNSVTLQIEGMTCASCASAVQKALAAAPGVKSATANFINRTATVTGDSIVEADLIQNVKATGYRARIPVRGEKSDEKRKARLELLKVAGIGALLLAGWLAVAYLGV